MSLNFDLDEETLANLLQLLPTLSESEQRSLLHDLQRLEEVKSREKCQKSSSHSCSGCGRGSFPVGTTRLWPVPLSA